MQSRGKQHGKSTTSEYRTWRSMRTRCRCDPHYQKLGICKAWDSFEQFRRDMGSRPSPRHQIDRIDNKLGYSATNCRWVTPKEQARNRSTNRIIELDGKRMPLIEALEHQGLNVGTFYSRLRRGCNEQRALTSGHLSLKGRPRNDSHKSNSRRITINGETFHLAEWLRRYGLTKQAFAHRVKVHDWSVEDAITIPSRNAKAPP